MSVQRRRRLFVFPVLALLGLWLLPAASQHLPQAQASARTVPKRSSIRHATKPSQTQSFKVQPGCVLIAATNDVHGALAPYTVASQDQRGAVSEGGVLTLSGYVQALRAQNPNKLLLLDAGDIFQGTMASNLSFGQAMVTAYNALGYDAAAIGNHEFDYGSGGDLDPNAELTQVLQRRIAEAHFPFLASNIDDAQTGRALAWPNLHASTLKDVGGVCVGVVGATTPTTQEATNPRYVQKLRFAAPAARIAAQAQSLRARGAALVVLLAHMGGRCEDRQNPNNWASCQQTGIENEMNEVLSAMPPGTVDVAIGGHTHQFMANWKQNTAVLESGSQGHYVGLVQACPQRRQGLASDPVPGPGPQLPGLDRSRSVIYPTQPLCLTTWKDGTCSARKKGTATQAAHFAGHKVRVMPQVAQVARPFLEAVDVRERASIGALLPTSLSAVELTGLIAEALRRATHADFGVQNRGGVRTAIAAGATTYKQVFEAVPFDNYATVLTLQGHELVALARALVGQRPAALRPVFSGLVATGAGDSLQLTTSKGAPIDADATYTLCTTDFILNGGDGANEALGNFPPQRAHIFAVTMRDTLVELLRALYPNPIAVPQ